MSIPGFGWLFGTSREEFPNKSVPKVSREEPWPPAPTPNNIPVSLQDAIEALGLCYRALQTGVGKNKAKNVASRVLIRFHKSKM